MLRQWFYWINAFILGLITLLACGIIILWIMRPSVIETKKSSIKKHASLRNPFSLPEEDYAAIGEPVLSIQFNGATLQVPDLRQHLVYYGKNGRPDSMENSLMHFSFNGNKKVVSVHPGERIYLIYDKTQTPCKYTFSENNEETSLWIEAEPQGSQAFVKIEMKDEKNDIIREPANCSQFQLQEKEYVRLGGTIWEIGPFRVDGSLLARQKARWFGPDLFLENHGGDDYHKLKGKHRVDIGDGGEIYSIFLSLGDCAIWEEGRWKNVKPGVNSLGKPLLIVKKIEERLMNFELWDVDGKGKVIINLLKSTEPRIAQNIQQDFKFAGARTRSQCVFEVNQERILLSPDDWFLKTDFGWRKLTATEEIDDYVERKTIGPLFVFEGIIKKDDKQLFVGKVYNASRTDIEEIELPLNQGGITIYAASDGDEDDDDDDDDDIKIPSNPILPVLKKN